MTIMLLKHQSSILTIAIILVVLTQRPYLTSSQQAPYYNLVQFEQIPNGTQVPRQNVCDRLQALKRGEVLLADALRGLDLHPAIAQAEYVVLDDEGRLDKDYPGLLPTLLDEIARRAGFRWRDSFGLTSVPEMTEGRTFPDLLEWTVKHFDVCIDWWPNNVDNAQRNVALSPHWYDASLILIWNPPEPNSSKFSFSFFAPFSLWVWLLTLATLIVSGFIFLIFEKMDLGSDDWLWNNWWKKRSGSSLREHFFLSAITFTGNFSYTPPSNPARLFAWSLTFLSLVWSASYTANLASFLVAKNRPTFVINSIEDAMQVGSLCVSSFTNAYDHISKYYPSAKFVQLETEVEMFQALNAGECICAATTVVSWSAHRQNIDANPDCNLERIPGTVAYFEASFGFQASLGWDKCTPLLRDVFQIHMIGMQEDGFIDKAWEYEFDRTMQIECDLKEDKNFDIKNILDDLEEDTFTLGLIDMGGIFVFHYILTAIALFCAACGRCANFSRKKESRLSIEKRDDLPQTLSNNVSNSIDESEFQDAVSQHFDNFEDNPVSSDFDQNLDSLEDNPVSSDLGKNLDDVIAYLKDMRDKQNLGCRQRQKGTNRRQALQMTKQKKNQSRDPSAGGVSSWASSTRKGF